MTINDSYLNRSNCQTPVYCYLITTHEIAVLLSNTGYKLQPVKWLYKWLKNEIK